MKTIITMAVFGIAFTQTISAQFKQAALPYAYNAFENVVDAQTMELHYSKNAAGYVNNLNKAVAGTALEKERLENILANISGHSAAVRNNVGVITIMNFSGVFLPLKRTRSLRRSCQKQ